MDWIWWLIVLLGYFSIGCMVGRWLIPAAMEFDPGSETDGLMFIYVGFGVFLWPVVIFMAVLWLIGTLVTAGR